MRLIYITVYAVAAAVKQGNGDLQNQFQRFSKVRGRKKLIISSESERRLYALSTFRCSTIIFLRKQFITIVCQKAHRFSCGLYLKQSIVRSCSTSKSSSERTCDLKTLAMPENVDSWSCDKPILEGKVEKYTRCKIVCSDGYDFSKGKQQKLQQLVQEPHLLLE